MSVLRRFPLVIVTTLFLLSASINALQVAKIRSMQAPLDHCIAALGSGALFQPRPAVMSTVGGAASALEVHDLAGKQVSVSAIHPGKLTVLYSFSPHCVWCKRNERNMQALMQAAGKRFEFVPISLDAAGSAEFLASLGFHGSAYTDPSEATRRAYGLGSTPETIVVGPDGKIMKDWKGAYKGGVSSEVTSTLGVRLPGVAE